jgi:hypothetical protein
MISKVKTNYRHLCSLAGFPDKEQFLSLEQLKKEVKSEGICSVKAYKKIYAEHSGWPSNPNNTYKEEWKEYFDFFGRKKPKYSSFLEIKKQLRLKGIKLQTQYYKVYKKYGWPSNPNLVYKKDWKNWADFLGTDFISFESFKKIVKVKKVKSQKHYTKLYRKYGWASTPSSTYKKEWKGWPDFLGKKILKTFSFNDLKKDVEAKRVKSRTQYRKVYRKYDWPSTPNRQYPNYWTNWYDFLGTKEPSFPSFKDLKKAIKKIGVKTEGEYKKIYKKYGWPSSPFEVYKRVISNMDGLAVLIRPTRNNGRACMTFLE